mmetsp:Transcript_42304/g.101878  ORF Transcript_42304/g.101878 Transcript_42304/m.101878 type:complete len:138 (-) Transcript_42304:1928-2341(-)
MTILHHTKSWFLWNYTTSCTKFGNKKHPLKNYREHSSSTNISDVNNENDEERMEENIILSDGENGWLDALLWGVLWPDTSTQLVRVRATMIHMIKLIDTNVKEILQLNMIHSSILIRHSFVFLISIHFLWKIHNVST